MCCLNVWPSASLQLYIVAHCDKQLHAPELSNTKESVIDSEPNTEVSMNFQLYC